MFQITYTKTMAPTTFPSRQNHNSWSPLGEKPAGSPKCYTAASCRYLKSFLPLPIPIWYHRRLLHMPTYWCWLWFSCTQANPSLFTGCMWLPIEFTSLSAGRPLPLQQRHQIHLRLAALACPLPRYGPCHARQAARIASAGEPASVVCGMWICACFCLCRWQKTGAQGKAMASVARKEHSDWIAKRNEIIF
jgi:hypothetical protein